MLSPGFTKRLSLLNRYYKITRFYSFLKATAIKGGTVIAFFVALIIGLEYYVLDFNTILNKVVETYPPLLVFGLFLASETIMGLLPPEIFIAWAAKVTTPWLYLFYLASLSYLGGIIAYGIGNKLSKISLVKNYLELKVATHISNLNKWGGLFVFLGAVSPVPHSLVSLASGLISYNFKNYLLWALFRYVRFLVYGFLIFKAIS
ncbi:YqaA family protein [Flavobacterium sp. ASW18X]|uniref:YqaA family protein n=1 Tax=Flavobacterium sp. ASW18X TaxID=2572595 RepID=UPI0010ADEC3E|nr:VTT domain-containing protein [Flavobacterium sp. ASW18X]TKD59204.1 VTT domain-containing protein [Flavobacterium sp. ASW18X]